MQLELASLEKALASLQRAIERTRQAPGDEELRDAVIQRFEYSYELCWKMLKRRLEMDSAIPTAIDALGFKDLIREAAERGLLNDPAAWFEYREQRNITAHTYNRAKAEAVYQTVLQFLPSARALLESLAAGNQAE